MNRLRIISVSAEAIETGTEENIQLASYDGSIKPLEELLDIAALREYLTTEMAKCTPEITVSQFGIPKTAVYVSALSELIFDEMPEIFHVSTYGYSYSQSTGKIVSVSPTYDCNAAEYAERMEACKTAAENILEDIKDNEKISDVQKALLIHDRLALWCAYDLENLENDTLQPEAYTMYGALGMGRAVCEGYANAYMYLLDQVGIDSYICSSMSLNHAWNIVEIDGMWYHVDVTWDDPVWDISGRVNHQNFLRSSEDFFENYGKPTSAANNVGCDINKDGCVNLIDIAVLLFVGSGN